MDALRKMRTKVSHLDEVVFGGAVLYFTVESVFISNLVCATVHCFKE